MKAITTQEVQQIHGAQFNPTSIVFISATFIVVSLAYLIRSNSSQVKYYYPGPYNPTFLGTSSAIDERNDIYDAYGHYTQSD